MKIDTRDVVSVSDAGRNLDRYVSEATAGRSVVIVRNNEPTGALVPLAAMDRLDRIDELEDDLLLCGVTLARTLTDSGDRYSLESITDGVDIDDHADA